MVQAFLEHFKHSKVEFNREMVQTVGGKTRELFRESLKDPRYDFMLVVPFKDFSQLVTIGEDIDFETQEGHIAPLVGAQFSIAQEKEVHNDLKANANPPNKPIHITLNTLALIPLNYSNGDTTNALQQEIVCLQSELESSNARFDSSNAQLEASNAQLKLEMRGVLNILKNIMGNVPYDFAHLINSEIKATKNKYTLSLSLRPQPFALHLCLLWASKGIGFAISLSLGKAGCKVSGSIFSLENKSISHCGFKQYNCYRLPLVEFGDE
ncbi:uncharacterized protein G2W53_041087 [Senna tora]|uniref:Uncharacterized protein n=1 Tax=Senna tora TaxID=362788 RepID=A0A834SEK1_9FABA|nr:uncharacterized protein G2W53_041087 [Senna tora]